MIEGKQQCIQQRGRKNIEVPIPALQPTHSTSESLPILILFMFFINKERLNVQGNELTEAELRATCFEDEGATSLPLQ